MSKSPRLYSHEEANAFIPQIAAVIPDLREIRETIVSIRDKHDVEEISSFGAKGGLAAEAKEKMASYKKEIKKLEKEFEHELELFTEIECELKSIAPGLVDFYTEINGELAFLCWREDETEIQYWHTLEGGFATRQRI